jgi:chemotaxis protein CheD
MHSRDPDLTFIYLKPGEIHATQKPALVKTILGSCVSAVLFNRRFSIGAICHALLPSGDCRLEGFKYLDCAMYWMLEWFDTQGIPRSEIEVKLFGGADVLSPGNMCYRGETIGRKNIQKALEIVERESLNLIAHDVGGRRGRKISFYTHTGQIHVERH